MVNELLVNMTKAKAPTPSVEAILHAIIPFKFVDHTHADSFIAISNSINGEQIIKNIYGKQVLIIPYVMPGFDLARELYLKWKTDSTSNTVGIVLMNHGLITFGDTTREAYLQHISIIKEASEFLDRIAPVSLNHDDGTRQTPVSAILLAKIRKEISVYARRPMIVQREDDELVTVTPDHLAEETAAAIREAMEGIKALNIPMIADVKTVQRWGEAK